MIQSLELRYNASLDATPEGWFLPGETAAKWLDELARCGLAVMETRLFVVPRSINDQAPAGLLIVPAQPETLSQPPAGIGCRLIAGRLFVPLEAALHPPITDAEARSLCALPVLFFHPSLGLSGFEETAALRVSDLIERPTELTSNWNFARPGATALPELNGVILLQPPSIEDVFGGVEDEIASEPPEDLPPAPGEPKEDTASKAQRFLRRAVARGVAEAMKQIPHFGSRRTWVNEAEDWANRQLRGLSDQLQQLRNKELHRLLHLLDTDPEQGLRHAIPMNNFAHRGTAPPGVHLGSHPLDFNPGSMGGRPADFWNVPSNLQQILRRRYREMADREMQLGRHRRAAYIYAELLGDLVSAANAFKQGKLYREAALLYEHHLKNPLEAARCLAEGGLLAEAIERYEKLGRWLDVADLHERAGDKAAAEKAIRYVVDERLGQKDVLGAARLVEERLHYREEALELLLEAWPSSHQAAGCLTAAFRILAQLGRHEFAEDRLAGLSREPLHDSIIFPLLATLGGVTRDYPHERVRHRAADLSRVLISRQLVRPHFSSSDAGRLLEHLLRLAPQDRLLSRDSNRYLAARRSAELHLSRVTLPLTTGNKPRVLRRFELPRQIQWLQLRRESHWFYALGINANHITLLRGIWEGEFQSLSWPCPAAIAAQGFIFEPSLDEGRAVALARAGGGPFVEKCFPASDLFFNRKCVAGTPSWLPTQGFPFAMGEDVVWSVHVATERAILSCHDKVRGQLQQTTDITDELLTEAERTPDTRLSIAAFTDGVAVALGNRLVIKQRDGTLIPVELPGQAIRVIATLPNTRRGVAVMLQAGALMYWVGSEASIELDRDSQSPIGAFIPNGPLVLASGSHAQLLEVDSSGVKSIVRQELTTRRAVGVCAAANPGEFAVLGENGEMTIYTMPR
jgi:tetratricopeptide (TPR) repeat protein